MPSTLNWVDITVIAITVLSFFFGLWRGLVKEVLSLVTWIAALLVARLYSEHLSPYLEGMIDGSTTRYVAAFAILFIVTMMLGTLLIHLLGKLLTIAGLRLTDRLLGGVFGVARGVIIVMLLMFFTGPFATESESWQQSILIPYGVELIEWSKIFIGDVSDLDMAADSIQ
jgi:membrane protein required for colicin V production